VTEAPPGSRHQRHLTFQRILAIRVWHTVADAKHT
jgi:hypothetical protein